MEDMRKPALLVLSTVVTLATLTPPVVAAPVAPVPAAWTREADRHAADGFRRLDAGDAGGAESAFRTAIALDPHQARAHAGLGIAMLRRGQPLAAAGHFQQAVSMPLPEDLAARSYVSLGMISDGQGQTEAAIRYVQRALRLQPRAIYQALLARLYLGAQRLDEARDAALAARRQDPDSPGVLAISGRVANAFGRHDEAITLLKQAIQPDQDNSEIYYELGLAYLGAGALTDAEQWLIGSAELNERRARTFDALAHVFMLQHKRDQAIRALQAKLQVDPEHRTVWPDLQAVESLVRAGGPVP
jgi:tetratricopeptide (TPR) repeat protein